MLEMGAVATHSGSWKRASFFMRFWANVLLPQPRGPVIKSTGITFTFSLLSVAIDAKQQTGCNYSTAAAGAQKWHYWLLLRNLLHAAPSFAVALVVAAAVAAAAAAIVAIDAAALPPLP